MIFQKCDACGEKSMVDMQHKLTTFILNRYASINDPGFWDVRRERARHRRHTLTTSLDHSCTVSYPPLHSHKKEKAASGGKKEKKKDKGDKVRCACL